MDEFVLDLTKPKIPMFTLKVIDPEDPNADVTTGEVKMDFDTIRVLMELFSLGIIEYAKDKDGRWIMDAQNNRQLSLVGQMVYDKNGKILTKQLTAQEEAEVNKKVFDACYTIFGLDSNRVTNDNAIQILKWFMAHTFKYEKEIAQSLAEKDEQAKVKKKNC
jgi:hypothetical protein